MRLATQKKLAVQPVEELIRIVRGRKVMLDHDLARLYGVETRTLNQAVRRNLDRFPDDFMFPLSQKEMDSLRSQIVISNVGRGGRRYMPRAFTEHGVVMLASLLNSSRAVQMSLLVVRAFVRMRELIATHKEFAVRIEKLERGHQQVDSVIDVLIEDINKLDKEVHWIKNPPLPRKHRIGFDTGKDVKK